MGARCPCIIVVSGLFHPCSNNNVVMMHVTDKRSSCSHCSIICVLIMLLVCWNVLKSVPFCCSSIGHLPCIKTADL